MNCRSRFYVAGRHAGGNSLCLLNPRRTSWAGGKDDKLGVRRPQRPRSVGDPSQLSWVFTCEVRGLRVLKVLSSSTVFMSLLFLFLSSLINAERLSHPSPQEADFGEWNPHSRAGRRLTHLPRAVFWLVSESLRCVLEEWSYLMSLKYKSIYKNLVYTQLLRNLFLSFFNLFFKFYGSTADLQRCADFCCITKWFNYTRIYTFSYSSPWFIIG